MEGNGLEGYILQIWRVFIVEGIGLEGYVLQIWRVFILEGICLGGLILQIWRVSIMKVLVYYKINGNNSKLPIFQYKRFY